MNAYHQRYQDALRAARELAPVGHRLMISDLMWAHWREFGGGIAEESHTFDLTNPEAPDQRAYAAIDRDRQNGGV